ncbi:MAG: phosphoribosylformylglycinamidine synthase subunit PurS [Calothrix sp. SM1_5_4]|nr:phosphoribosylformylglycinamidine synthase subunit PurS [Calothrix sp. SM1_5_4]
MKILPKNEVLDTQGRAVEGTLKAHQRAVNQCRVGKYVQLDLPESDEAAALAKAKEIAEFVLYNPLIETFELEVVKR